MDKGVFVKNCESMSLKLFEVMEMEFEDTTEFDRQMLAMFSFGMISSYGMEENAEVDIVSVASEYVLIKVFRYSKEQAGTFLNLLIDSTKRKESNILSNNP